MSEGPVDAGDTGEDPGRGSAPESGSGAGSSEPPAGRPEEVEFHPPASLLRVAETLESRGFEAWAVGGAVRDELLGSRRADWDLATDARPEDVRRVFRRTVPVGIEHGTVGVLGEDDVLYEVTTFRRDVDTDGRHAVVEFAASLEEDLARRDFTINAVAWRPETDELRDPFDGRADLERGVLRAVGVPARRFREDYLRVLRGLRFAGRFGLRIEERTRDALEEATSGLGRLSAERVREELLKVLADERPSDALRLYAETGAFEPWLSELTRAAGSGRWELDLGAVDALSPTRRRLRVARLLMPVADEGDAREAAGRDILQRLKFSNAELQRVTHLLRHYPPVVSPVDSSAEVRLWLAEVGPDAVRDLFRLGFADARAAGAEERGRLLVAAWRRVHDELLDSPPLRIADLALDGNDLIGLGVSQGPIVGLLLDELHALVLEDPELNRPDVLREHARELIEMGALDTGPRGAGSSPAGGPPPSGGPPSSQGPPQGGAPLPAPDGRGGGDG